MAFVFYDTETTGLEHAFDQILQFAAIRTDDELNELERFEIRCRLQPHIVPSPGAMRATRVSVRQLTDPKYPSHYEMMRTIRAKLMSWSPAIFIGHNSIEYDEKMLRQAFYQTLHPLYLTNTDGNARMDSLKMVRAASLYAPDSISVPQDGKKKVFKLEQLAPANGFNHPNAHDALADVEATIYMCRLLSQKCPSVWSNAIRFSQKSAVLDYALSEKVFSFSDFYGGLPYSYLVTGIGVNPDDGAEIFIYDLEADPSELVGLSASALQSRLDKKPKPVRRFRANGCPIIMPSQDAPVITPSLALGIPELERRATELKSNPALCERLMAAYMAKKEKYEASPYVEEQIYNGFYSPEDRKRLIDFHEVSWEHRAFLINEFEDGRLKVLGARILYYERPDLLDDTTRRSHKQFIAEKLTSAGEVPWLTLSKAIQKAEELLAESSAEQVLLLQEHKEHLTKWLADLDSIQSARSA